jgi:hypothetical protein
MSKIKAFRVNAFDTVTDEVEFYCKIKDEEERVLCNLCIADGGIYYYRTGSHILTPNEKAQTRSSYDGSLSMDTLKTLFEALIKAGLTSEFEDSTKLHIMRQGKRVIIEVR